MLGQSRRLTDHVQSQSEETASLHRQLQNALQDVRNHEALLRQKDDHIRKLEVDVHSRQKESADLKATVEELRKDADEFKAHRDRLQISYQELEDRWVVVKLVQCDGGDVSGR